jgi:hypothetical protein
MDVLLLEDLKLQKNISVNRKFKGIGMKSLDAFFSIESRDDSV